MSALLSFILSVRLTVLLSPFSCRTVDFQEFVDMMTGKMSERDSKEEIQKVRGPEMLLLLIFPAL